MSDPIVLTKEIIRGWTGEETLKAMRDLVTRAEIERVMNTPDKTQEQIQAEADAVVQAEEAARIETERVEAERVAASAAAVEAARIVEIPVEPVKQKIVVKYQATDGPNGTGNPIGRPTNIEGDTTEEVIEKLKQAHVNAVQAYERLKAQKVTFKQPEAPVQIGLTPEQIAEISKELDPDPEKAAKLAASIRKLTNAEAVEKHEQELREREEKLRGKELATNFMRKHISDFNPCKANSEILGTFLKENNLEWTEDNLEIAFAAKYSELAPVETRPVVPPVDNPPASAPVIAPIIPTPPPAAVVPLVVPVVENPPTVPHRVPSAGIEPGSMGGRPTPKSTSSLTKQEIAKWTGEQMRKELIKPGRREEINKVLAGQ